MPTPVFNYLATIISVISIIIATISSYQTYRNSQTNIRPYVYLYLVSTKNGTYVKIKNFGKSNAKLKNFSTNVDLTEYKSKSKNNRNFPYVGLKDITIVPGSSKVAIIDNQYLNNGNWLQVDYTDSKNKNYSFKLELNTYNKYALVSENDFDIIDY